MKNEPLVVDVVESAQCRAQALGELAEADPDEAAAQRSIAASEIPRKKAAKTKKKD